MHNDIAYYEKESQKFDPFKHFMIRIQDMKQHSHYGAVIAEKWEEVLSENLTENDYPVTHPIGEETFSLFAEYPAGIYEYAFHIDGASSLIKEKQIEPSTYPPQDIIKAVDIGNINTNPELIRPNHKNPVMVIQSKHLTNDKMYAINGNHRIFEAFRNKDESIEVYVFKDREFIPFFHDYLSKISYFMEIDYTNTMHNKRFFLKTEEDAFVYKL